MQKHLPVGHSTRFEHFTYVVYITTDEQNVHNTNAYVVNEIIHQFGKPIPPRIPYTTLRVCGERKHSPIHFVCKRIIVKAYDQYFHHLMVILSILRFQMFMLDRVPYGN